VLPPHTVPAPACPRHGNAPSSQEPRGVAEADVIDEARRVGVAELPQQQLERALDVLVDGGGGEAEQAGGERRAVAQRRGAVRGQREQAAAQVRADRAGGGGVRGEGAQEREDGQRERGQGGVWGRGRDGGVEDGDEGFGVGDGDCDCGGRAWGEDGCEGSGAEGEV